MAVAGFSSSRVRDSIGHDSSDGSCENRFSLILTRRCVVVFLSLFVFIVTKMKFNLKIIYPLLWLSFGIGMVGCGAFRETRRPDGLINGYRVQLIETDDRSAALDARNLALLRFRENVYLIFEPPLYKVRVGDFGSREGALRLQDEAIRKGFKRAWVVGAKIAPDKIRPARE